MEDVVKIGIYNGFGVDPYCFTETQIWIERNLGKIESKTGKPLFEIINRSPNDNIEDCAKHGLKAEHLKDAVLLNSVDVLVMPGGNALEYISGIEAGSSISFKKNTNKPTTFDCKSLKIRQASLLQDVSGT